MNTVNKCILIALCAVIGLNAQAQLKVGNGGRVGIGTEPPVNPSIPWLQPNDKLAVKGEVYFQVIPDVGGFRMSAPKRNQVYYDDCPVLFSDFPNYPGVIGQPFSTGLTFPGQNDGNPIYKIHAMEIYYGWGLYLVSDSKMKTNIVKAQNSTTKLNKVNVYQYDLDEKLFSFQDTKVKQVSMGKYKKQTGVMAQEIKEIFPELVSYDSVNDLHSVNYVGFIPHLIQAVQAQSKEIETLKTELAYYQTNCCSANKDIKKSTIANDGTTGKVQLSDVVANARLDQNAPNPFSKETQIGYFIPTGAKNAYLFIYDLQGKQLKQITLNIQGEGSTTIQGREFTAGMYLYSLIIDNELVDTRRMILTE